MRWLEVRVSADNEAVEAVSELFARYGYQGGVAIEEQYLQDRDGDNLRVDTTAPVTVPEAFTACFLMLTSCRESPSFL